MGKKRRRNWAGPHSQKPQCVTVLSISQLVALNPDAANAKSFPDLQQALSEILETMNIEAGGIYLYQKSEQVLTVATQKGYSMDLAAKVDALKVGEGFSGRVAQSGEPMVFDNRTDSRLSRAGVKDAGFGPEAVAPILAPEHKILGTLWVTTRAERKFSKQDLELLATFGQQIGLALWNANLVKETNVASK